MTILGVSNINLGDIWWKPGFSNTFYGNPMKIFGSPWNFVGLWRKSGSSNENVGVFNKNLGSPIKICENLGSRTKIWESHTKIWESHTKICEPYTKISESRTKIWGLQFIANAPFNVISSYTILDTCFTKGCFQVQLSKWQLS